MDLKEDLEAAQSRLDNLRVQHSLLTLERRAPSVSAPAIGTIDQKEAVAVLRTIFLARTPRRLSEIQGLIKAASLWQQRTSLLLRYRHDILVDDAAEAAEIIASDLEESSKAGQLAKTMMTAVQSSPEVDCEEVKSMISGSLAETSRLLGRITGGVLPPEEDAAFHSLYETPGDPYLSYVDKTTRLIQCLGDLFNRRAAWVEHTMTDICSMDHLIKPSFAEFLDLAADIDVQATEMMQENASSFLHGEALLLKTRNYLASSPKRNTQENLVKQGWDGDQTFMLYITNQSPMLDLATSGLRNAGRPDLATALDDMQVKIGDALACVLEDEDSVHPARVRQVLIEARDALTNETLKAGLQGLIDQVPDLPLPQVTPKAPPPAAPHI